MIANFLFFFLSFVLGGSHFFPSSSSTILKTFNEIIMAGDTNALKSFIEANSEYTTNPSAMPYRNAGLLTAVQEGHAPVVELLLQNVNVDASAYNNIAIRGASFNGNVDIVKLLLARPEVDPGASENIALIGAVSNGHTEIVRVLLEHPKIDPTIGANDIAYYASSMNREDILKLFIIDGRINPSFFEFTLEKAAERGNVDLVRFLLGYQFFGHQAKFVAFKGNLKSIQTLVEAGYKIDQETLYIFLENARMNGNEDIVEYLETLKEILKLPERPLIPMTEQCAICLSHENLLEGFMTSCNHQFHAECLQQWIAKHNSCPICRSSII
jgi:ankyrin repeat protein